MKKKFLFLLFVFFCFLPAAGQQTEYMITDSELTKLETLLEKWENIKQTQLSQIRNLETELSEALKYQASLTDQLTQARLSLRKSEKSFAEYETESGQLIAEKQTMIDKLKSKNHRLVVTVVVLSAVLGIGILASTILIVLKKRQLLSII